jgi:uncharacterized membrane protein
MAVLAVTLGAALWLAGVFTESRTLHVLYAPVCHQAAERSLSLAGGHLAVCARCTGLYLGGVLGLLSGAVASSWMRRTPRWLFFAAVAPTALDALASLLGLPSLANFPRFLLAIPAGAVCGWFLAMAVGDLVCMLRPEGTTRPRS